jgi:hypothetical protein
MGFSHRGGRRGLFLPEAEAIQTPVGQTLLDAEAMAALLPRPEFRRVEEDLVCDHSVEIQLPLLQRAAPEAQIVPVYVNRPDPLSRAEAARSLASLAGPDTVFVASSDFTHYGRDFGFQPFPVDGRTAGRLSDLDNAVIDAAGSVDSEMFLDSIRETSATVCGVEPIALLLETLRCLDGPEVFQRRLDYQTSGDITGDYHNSVSYATLGYFPRTSFEIDPDGQALLLASARRTLATYQETGRRKPIPLEDSHPALAAHLGAFVTIYVAGDPRGCVGQVTAVEPLSRLIPELALSAALDDSRFESLTARDTNLTVEISILTPMKRVRDRSAFLVNEHGALLKSGFHQGLLLPQVATERAWDADQFFAALARKAGAHPKVYDDPGAKLYVFRAQHF